MEFLELDLINDGLLKRTLDSGQTLGDALTALSSKHPTLHAVLESHTEDWPLGWLQLPEGGNWVADCLSAAKALAEECEELIVCGIGGSALGTQAVYAALDWPLDSLRTVSVVDNVDPSSAAWLAEMADIPNSAVNVISKSGGTLETMAAFFFMLDMYEMLNMEPVQIAGRVVATTDAEHGLLHALATDRGWRMLPVPGDVGGRFSVLSPVGLLPLAFAGIDVNELLRGARGMQEWMHAQPQQENPAWQLAAMSYLLHMQGGIRESVHYIYGDPLTLLGDWFRQLWAESLAKGTTLDGAVSKHCLTPVTARGTTDQHSQNQLYMEGLDDKLYGFITCDMWPVDPVITVPNNPALEPLNYMHERTFGSILSACCRGTRDALIEAGRPTYAITFPSLNAASVGAYLQMWMLATAYAGMLYNVNAFNQPGVERCKVITKALLRKADH